MKVICVYKPQRGFDMTEDYVLRLQENVERYLSIQHEFCCITPLHIPGVTCLEPQFDWPSYWSKMEIFWHAKDDLNLYLDLDTIPCNDLCPIFSRAICSPAGTILGSEDRMARGSLNSSVMCWRGALEYLTLIFRSKWRQDPKRVQLEYQQSLVRYGDQGFIQDHLLSPPEFLGNLACSYKLDDTEDKKSAAIVFFHGTPRPHQVGWMPW